MEARGLARVQEQPSRRRNLPSLTSEGKGGELPKPDLPDSSYSLS